ncbi:twin-arginine translocase TatA/TatE family subunit [Acuticoccus sp. I52.16.1]|uniref:twin-arginine translocase TatA/TatE family subunit n=1 Tax=Acuticoccus sp. I52.16.1 TaxID=2928472 RepID=UPI001FD60781|nr:twin-arginine translocase TatA/TatE family subunit [Acuticoccus sp. I52.16.1]UOM34538.1 twin-arginine translocase TatA/TatE family subunit [Acuticoccus sp. I52.16.1]
MGISVWQVLIIGIVLILLFGRGKISDLMGDVAKGIKSFKKGMAEDEDDARTIDHSPSSTVNAKEQERHNA